MFADPCAVQPMTALPLYTMYFKLHCIVQMSDTMISSREYNSKLFGGAECEWACCSTHIDTFGERSVDSMLYDGRRAKNTIDAIVASKHCPCEWWERAWCKCPLLEALQKKQWEGVETPVYKSIQGTLQKCEDGVKTVVNEARVMKDIALEQLMTVCHNVTYSRDVLERCNYNGNNLRSIGSCDMLSASSSGSGATDIP